MSSNFPEEITHLKMIEEKLQDALVKLDKKVAGYNVAHFVLYFFLLSYIYYTF